MSNAISHNAYGLLGINIVARQRDVSKRIKDISNLACIGEKFKDGEWINENAKNYFLSIQNDKTIKEARNAINTIENQVLHAFFSANNICDELTYALSITYDILNSKLFDKIILSITVKKWAIVLKNKYIFSDFKDYMQSNHDNISDTVFRNLNVRISEQVYKLFADIVQKNFNENLDIAGIVINGLGINKIDDENKIAEYFPMIKNIFTKMQNNIDTIKDIDIFGTEIEIVSNVRKIVKIAQQTIAQHDNLKQMGIYDIEIAQNNRDKIAECLRNKAIELHNEYNRTDESITITEIALKIASKNSLKRQLKEDIETLKCFETNKVEMKKAEELLKQITKNIEKLKAINGFSFSKNNLETILINIESAFSQFENNASNEDAMMMDKIRDTIAIVLRGLSIELHNKYNNLEDSLWVITIAQQWARNYEMISVINNDIQILNNNARATTGNGGFGWWIFWIIVILIVVHACSS